MLIRILLMSTLAFAAFPQDAMPMPNQDAVQQLDGRNARALAAAYATFREKLPEADITAYTVEVHAPAEGAIRVVFSPKLAPGEKPTLGGRTSQGREISVWVSAEDYSVVRSAFSR
jgi:hypothetical protein